MMCDIGGYAAKRDALECTETAQAHNDKTALILNRNDNHDLARMLLLIHPLFFFQKQKASHL